MGCGASTASYVTRASSFIPGSARALYKKSVQSYLPAAVGEYYAKRGSQIMPVMENFVASLMYVEIIGFSQLLEQLSLLRDTDGGLERLTYFTNEFMGEILDIVWKHGGDVTQFSGDSFMTVWKSNRRNLADATLTTIFCSSEIHNYIKNTKIITGTQPSVLSAKIEIGAGDVNGMHFGPEERLTYEVMGPEVENTFKGEKLNEPGKTVLTQAGYEALRSDVCLAEQIGALDYFKLQGIATGITRPSINALPTALANEDTIVPYIPANLRDLLRDKKADFISDVVKVTMVLTMLPKFSFGMTDRECGQFMNENFSAVVKAATKFGGMLVHSSSDQRGVYCVVAFGIPAHEDDAVRGMRTAVEITKLFSEREVHANIGVATGVVTATSVGSRRRSHYTIYGDTVTLASKLMAAAINSVLCDETTSLEAKSFFSFKEDQIDLKPGGKIKVYVPEVKFGLNSESPRDARETPVKSPMASPFTSTAHMKSPDTTQLAGRKGEEGYFLDLKTKMIDERESSCTIIEADVGQGRASLIRKFAEHASFSGFRVLYSEADPIDNSPYYAFKGVILQLCKMNAWDSLESSRENISKRLPKHLLPYADVLNSILPYDFPSSEQTSALKGNARFEMINKILSALFLRIALYSPTALFLQEAQWLDQASWNALEYLIRNVHPLIVIVGTRPIPKPTPHNFKSLGALGAKKFTLNPLTERDAADLVIDKFGLPENPPENLLNYVVQAGSGLPLFMVELIERLKSQEEMWKLEDDVLKFDDAKAGADQKAKSVQLLVTAKVESASPDEQLLIRIASIIGKTFKWPIVEGVFPSSKRSCLLASLTALEELDLLAHSENREVALEGKIPFSFKDATIHQIIYESMDKHQRKKLHLTVAEWLVNNYEQKDNGPTYYPEIYRHYEHARKHKEAFVYAVKAAEHFTSLSCLYHACWFFKQAFHSSHFKELSQAERAKIQMSASEAYMGCGQIVEGTKLVHQALVNLGCPDPVVETQKYTEEELVQQFHSISVETIAQDDLMERERQLEILTLYSRIAFSFNHLLPNSFAKACVYGAICLKRILLATGYDSVLPGLVYAISLAFSIVSDQQTASKYRQMAKEYLRKPIVLEGVPTAFQQTLSEIRARTNVFVFVALYTACEFKEMDEYYKLLYPQIKETGDTRGIFLCASCYAHSLLYQGRFAEARVIFAEHVKLLPEIGDCRLYNLIHPASESYCRIRLGNAYDAFYKLQQAERVTANTSAASDNRVRTLFSCIRALCHLYKKDHAEAFSCALEAEKGLLAFKVSTPFHKVGLLAFVEVMSELALDPNFGDARQALESWERVTPLYEKCAVQLPAMQASVLHRRALLKCTTESEGKDREQVKSKFIADLLDAMERSQQQHLNLQYDFAVIHSLLAKSYETTDTKALDNFTKAQALFNKTGSLLNYIDLKENWDRRQPTPTKSTVTPS